MTDWLNKKVRTTKDMDYIPKGSIGKVTADLSNEGKDGVFAVWFENISLQLPWIKFPIKDKLEYFELIE